MGGMGGGMGGNTMMDNGMMGSIPSLMETSGSRSMGGRGDHRGDVRDQFTMLLDFFQGMYNRVSWYLWYRFNKILCQIKIILHEILLVPFKAF